MITNIAITVIGPDRPGLVNLLSTCVAKHHANWLDSRMSNLGGQFAGILRISLPSKELDALTAELQSLTSSGLHATISEISDASGEKSGHLLNIEVLGQDRAGIVRDLTQALVTEGITIEELETSTQSASMSGDLLFYAFAELKVPESISIDSMELIIDRLSDNLNVDIDLKSPETISQI